MQTNSIQSLTTQIILELARTDFRFFIKATKPDFEFNWHHELMFKILQRFIAGEIQNLCIEAPPRHTKSESVSRRLPAFLLGIDPTTKIILGSYNDSLASAMNRDVQRIIDTEEYQSVFPNTKLNGMNAVTSSRGAWLRNADQFETVGFGGGMKTVGRGAGITGFGASCFVAGTLIETEDGLKPIEKIVDGDWVLSFNHQRKKTEYRRVQATQFRNSNDIYKIRTDSGAGFKCTGNHPIFICGQGYTEARHLRIGQRAYTVSPSKEDTVSLVQRLCNKSERVYDLQVEGNHNFFANGILVHNCLIIDDPLKNRDEANSKTIREKTWDWFTNDIMTRLEGKKQMLITQTRWHEDDLIGRIRAHEKEPDFPKFEYLTLQAIKTDNIKQKGDERKEGEALWATRYPIEYLNERKASLGRDFSSLYQQRPSPAGGGIIKREWLKYYKAPPDKFHEIIQSWDMAFKGKADSDFVVGTVWGRYGANKYLLDMTRARMDFPQTIQAVRQLSYKHPKAYAKIVEDKANGPAIIAELKSEISGLIAYSPKDSKEARLHSVSTEFESGNVFLPDPSLQPWVKDYVEELVSFPSAAQDDQVDSTTQALIRFRDSASDLMQKLVTM